MQDDLVLRVTFAVSVATVWVAQSLIRSAYTTTHRVERSVKDRTTFVLLVWVASISAYAIGFNGYGVPLPLWVRWIGIGAMLACIPLSLWIHHALGVFFSPKLQVVAGHELVQTGPYRLVRHPMYATLFICMLGTSLASADLVIGGASLAGIIAMLVRLQKEERMLENTFGEAYRTYQRTTGAIIPRLG